MPDPTVSGVELRDLVLGEDRRESLALLALSLVVSAVLLAFVLVDYTTWIITFRSSMLLLGSILAVVVYHSYRNFGVLPGVLFVFLPAFTVFANGVSFGGPSPDPLFLVAGVGYGILLASVLGSAGFAIGALGRIVVAYVRG